MPPKGDALKSVSPEGRDEQRLRFEGRADSNVAAISGPSGDAESFKAAAKALHDPGRKVGDEEGSGIRIEFVPSAMSAMESDLGREPV